MWVNWFLKGRNKEINEGFAPKNQVLRLKKPRKECSQQTSCKHQVTQIFFPPNMSNLTVAGFVPYQAPWILYLAIHIKRVEIELKTPFYNSATKSICRIKLSLGKILSSKN